MGLNIKTATALLNYFITLGPANGFTNGDPQAGIPPTQLDEEFFNALIYELNHIIVFAGTTPAFTQYTDLTQIAEAIQQFVSNRAARTYVSPTTWTMRTFTASIANAYYEWIRRQRQDYRRNVAQSTTQTMCTILDIPDNSQGWATFHGLCVQTDSLTTYSHTVLRASFRKAAGSTTIQKTTVVDSDGALGVTWSVPALQTLPCLRAVLPAAPGKVFNLYAYGETHNVTTL